MSPEPARVLPDDLTSALADRQLAVLPGGKLEVTVDDKGKLRLPPLPAHDDAAAQCAWLTAVFALNPEHPITGGEWQGVAGPDGHLVLRRAGATDLRFEPARVVKTAAKLNDAFTGRRHRTDPIIYTFKNEHCSKISYVVELLCDASAAFSAEEEMLGVIGTYLHRAEPAEGYTTYGTPAQRYEAARALRSNVYLIDASTGPDVDLATGEFKGEGKPVQYVIGVSDLAAAAREHLGSALARGWLDAHIQAIGWERIRLQGFGHPGRAGRKVKNAHARIDAYRGSLPDDPNDSVNT